MGSAFATLEASSGSGLSLCWGSLRHTANSDIMPITTSVFYCGEGSIRVLRAHFRLF